MLGAVPNPVFLPTHATSYQSSNQQPADILQTVLQQIADHSKRLDDHDRIHTEIARLQKELSAAHLRIADLEQVNAQLSAQLNTQQEPLSSFGSQIDFDQLDSQAPKPISATSTNNNSRLPSTNPWTNSNHINNTIKQTTTKKYNLKRQARKEQAAIRFFQPPSANQGFQYLYFNTKTRMPIGQVRRHLRSININNGRILDIYYPEKNILALLIHNDFTDELKSQLGQHGITPKTSYDPTSPDILHDKKYQDMTTQDRTDIAFRLHVERMERAVRNIRYPVSLTVAHAFLEHGWISEETIAELAPNNKNKNIFNTTGISKYSINSILQHTTSSTLLFITETWLLPPNKFITNWPQNHTYGQIRSQRFRTAKAGISLLVNPNCQLQPTIITDHNPAYSQYHLSCIFAGTLYHCLYLPPSISTEKALDIIQHLPKRLPHTVNTIYCGDFNARLGNYTGDHRTDPRGTQLHQWILNNDLTLWNTKLSYGQPTVYHNNGTSIVDFFISTHDLTNPTLTIRDDLSLGSNHKMLHLEYELPENTTPPSITQPPRPIWKLSRLRDLDKRNAYITTFQQISQPLAE
ncbi:endonuclease-reverse transcriptase-domain-containing protein, partial [Circinella umbellata]